MRRIAFVRRIARTAISSRSVRLKRDLATGLSMVVGSPDTDRPTKEMCELGLVLSEWIPSPRNRVRDP